MTHVLLAEDSAVNREMLREMLEAWGCAVVEAAGGDEALEKLQEGLPDLVLLDIRMPQLDGYQVLERIRAHPQWRRLPVIALTAFAMDGDRERGLAAGFDGYLTKPVDSQALRAALERHARPQDAAAGSAPA
jgi:CheY-like chemotaxis protein